MSAHTVTWLHLSDLHTCKPRTGWDAYRVLETLEKDLVLMQGTHGLRPDFIVFTGDAAFGQLGPSGGLSISEQFADAETFFTRVRNAFSPPIPKDRFFIVPGNHDVDRTVVTDAEKQWLASTSQESITRMIQSTDRQWGQIIDRLASYRTFLEREGYPHLLQDTKRLIFSKILDISGIDVGIAGFNSAWSCCRDKEKGSLWLAGGWQCAELHGSLKDARLTLALVHHPVNWFVPQEDPKIWRTFERDFTFLLHGHEHQGWVQENVDGHVRIAASACYETSDSENGYNFVRVNVETKTGEIFLRQYDALGGGWIPRNVHGKTVRDGIWQLRTVRILSNAVRETVSMQPERWVIEFTIGGAFSESKASVLLDSFRTVLGRDPSSLEITGIWKGSTIVRVEGSKVELVRIIRQLTDQADVLERFAAATGLTKLAWDSGSDRRELEVKQRQGADQEITEVDFSSRSLTDVPEELRSFAHIQRLDLSQNQLEALPNWVGQFTELRELDLSRNQLSALPDQLGEISTLKRLILRGNSLTRLPETLQGARQLEVLDLTENQLTELPNWIGSLRQLRELYLAGNCLAILPESLGHLRNLEILSASANQLRHVPEWLGTLKNLQSLSIAGNQVRSLPRSFTDLARLRHLDLSANAFDDLPEGLGKLFELQKLDLDRNPLSPDLAAAYQEGQEVVLRFLRARAEGAIILNEAKLILVGEGEVGKSSLLGAMRDEPWDENRSTTHGIEIRPITVPNPMTGTEITLNGWDFGGQRVYRPTHQLFFSAPAVYLVVWKPREGPQQGFVKEWIKLVKHREPEAKILVVATHGGPKERQPDIDRQEIWDLFGKATVIDFFHVDNRSRRGIDELRNAIARVAASLPEVGRMVPKRWEDARRALHSTKAAYMQFEQVLALCREHNMDENEARLFMSISHRLGHLIHYAHDPDLRDFVILKPDWLATAISYVLDDLQTRENHGLVSFSRLQQLWNDSQSSKEHRYPRQLHRVFLRLMERFDLSYRVAESDKSERGNTSLIAQLVPDVRPNPIPTWEQGPVEGDTQQMQICRIVETANNHSATAEGLFYQLIVRLHKYSLGRANFQNSVHWQRGLVLEDDMGARAFLEHIGNDVRITVRSPYPERFLSSLTSEVKWLVENFWQGLRCEVTVPCLKTWREGVACTGLFEVAKLIESKRRGRAEYPCPVCTEWENIDQLLDNAPAARPNPIEELLANPAEMMDVLEGVRRQLGGQQAQIIGRFDNLDAVSKEIVSKVEAAYSGLMHTLLDEAKEGPRLFSFEPTEPGFLDRPKWTSAKFRLTLWCEHSRMPLWCVSGDPRMGVYTIDLPREWLVKAAPFLKVVSSTLGLMLPVVAANPKVALMEVDYKKIEGQLTLGKSIAESLLERGEKAGEWLARNDGLEIAPGSAIRVDGAVLRQLHGWLKKKDPTFGGMVRVQNKRHEFLWVCPLFESEY